MIPAEHSPSKRDEILEVAAKLFYEQGYHRTGVKQIIEAAGTAKGTFYSHFASKEELGLAWLKARHRQWNGWLQEAIRGRRTAKTRILGIFDFLGEWMGDCGYRGCAFLNTLCETPEFDNPLRKAVTGHKRGLLDLFRALVAEHHRDRPEDECEHVAATLFLLFEGALIEMQNFGESWPLEAAKRQARNLL